MLVALGAGLSGCVGGAAVDGDAVRQAALAYPTYRAPGLAITTEPARALPRGPFPEQAFHHQPRHVLVARGIPARFDDCLLRFDELAGDAGLQVQVRCPADVAAPPKIDERIPRAFYMGDLQVARLGEGTDAPWVLRARARTTTGRYWLGLYRADGQAWLKLSLPHAQMALAEVEPGRLVLVASNGQRTVIRWP